MSLSPPYQHTGPPEVYKSEEHYAAVYSTAKGSVSAIKNDLRTSLETAQVEAAKIGGDVSDYAFFLPRCELPRLITPEKILQYIAATHPSCHTKDAISQALSIHRSSRTLFAILASIEEGGQIIALCKEGISDKDLPFRAVRTVPGNGYELHCEDGRVIQSMKEWGIAQKIRFCRCQYRFLAPVLKLESSEPRYENGVVIPFVKNEVQDMSPPYRGGYSQVFKREVHPSHHEFPNSGQFQVSVSRITSVKRCLFNDMQTKARLVAVKQLVSHDLLEFQQETHMLRRLGISSEPHLIKLLASYTHTQRHYLLFDWATSNLRDFWVARPDPQFNNDIVFWVIRQMTGISSALSRIHDFKTTLVVGPGGLPDSRDSLGNTLRVQPNEKVFGRHGDIKPDNFLYFEDMPDRLGIVQIADFGLARFHGRETRSHIDPQRAHATPTYEPPELDLQKDVSRKYDIWSLGCVYLEFITWMLKGAHATVEDFPEHRGVVNALGYNDDKFFEIVEVNGSKEAQVKEGVVGWVDELHRHPRCCRLIHELLDLIMSKMMNVDQEKRISAAKLHREMRMMKDKLEEDREGMLSPCEWAAFVPPRTPSPRQAYTWPQSPNTPQVPQILVSPPQRNRLSMANPR